MLRSRVAILAGICLLFCCVPLVAQQHQDSAYADRALVRLSHRLAADPAYHLVPGDLERLVSLLDSAEMEQMADSTVYLFLRVMTATIDQADSTDCISLLEDDKGQGAKAFLRPLRRMDSTTVDLWIIFLEHALHDRVTGYVPNSKMTQEEAAATFMGILGQLDQETRVRLMASMNSQVAAEQCWAMRTFFAEMAKMPIEEAGRMFRATRAKQGG